MGGRRQSQPDRNERLDRTGEARAKQSPPPCPDDLATGGRLPGHPGSNLATVPSRNGDPFPSQILKLQSLVGNNAVTKMLATQVQRDIEQGSNTGWGMWGAAKDPLWVRLSPKFNVELPRVLGEIDAVPARQRGLVTTARAAIAKLRAEFNGPLYYNANKTQRVSAADLEKEVDQALAEAAGALRAAQEAETEAVRLEEEEAERVRQQKLEEERQAQLVKDEEARVERERVAKEEAARKAEEKARSDAAKRKERKAKALEAAREDHTGEDPAELASQIALGRLRVEISALTGDLDTRFGDELVVEFRDKVRAAEARIEERLNDPLFRVRAQARGDVVIIPVPVIESCHAQVSGLQRESARVWAEWGESVRVLAVVPDGPGRRSLRSRLVLSAREARDPLLAYIQPNAAHIDLALDCLDDAEKVQPDAAVARAQKVLDLLTALPVGPARDAARRLLADAAGDKLDALVGYLRKNQAHIELAMSCLGDAETAQPDAAIAWAQRVLDLLTALPDGPARGAARSLLVAAPVGQLDELIGFLAKNRARIVPALECLEQAVSEDPDGAAERATVELDSLAPFNYDRKQRDKFAGLVGSAIDTDVGTKKAALAAEEKDFLEKNPVGNLVGQKKKARNKERSEKQQEITEKKSRLEAAGEKQKTTDVAAIGAFLNSQKFGAEASAVAEWAVGFAAGNAEVLRSVLGTFQLCTAGTAAVDFIAAVGKADLAILAWSLPKAAGKLDDAMTIVGLRASVDEKPLAILLKTVAIPTLEKLVGHDTDGARLERLRKLIGDADGTVLLSLLEPIGSSNAKFSVEALATILGYLCADGLTGSEVLEVLTALSNGGLGAKASSKRLEELRGTTYVPDDEDDDDAEARTITDIPTRTGADILANKAAKPAGKKFLSGRDIYIQVVAGRDAIDISGPVVVGVAPTPAPRGVDTIDTHYPTGQPVAGRDVERLWKDADPDSTKLPNLGQRDTEETDEEQAIRVKMAYKALLKHPTLQAKRVRAVYAYDYGRTPRPIFSPQAEDKLGAGTAHIVQRHVLGTPGISSEADVRSRAAGNYVNGVPPAPGIAGAFRDSGSAQAGIQGALTAWATKANWRTMRSEIVTGAAVSTIDKAFASNGFVHRVGPPAVDIAAPTRVHVVFNGDDVDGGFYVQSAWPLP